MTNPCRATALALTALALALPGTCAAPAARADEPAAPVEIGTPPFPHAARATNTAVKITWGAVPDADGYVVYK
ncbi:MAG: hypothetical protein LBR32_09055, partial [Propionibacteriaceae bacterium]|nr:hypothetical protein [Propionibacteriaceae bacterium]